jgi:hypothetical protein
MDLALHDRAECMWRDCRLCRLPPLHRHGTGQEACPTAGSTSAAPAPAPAAVDPASAPAVDQASPPRPPGPSLPVAKPARVGWGAAAVAVAAPSAAGVSKATLDHGSGVPLTPPDPRASARPAPDDGAAHAPARASKPLDATMAPAAALAVPAVAAAASSAPPVEAPRLLRQRSGPAAAAAAAAIARSAGSGAAAAPVEKHGARAESPGVGLPGEGGLGEGGAARPRQWATSGVVDLVSPPNNSPARPPPARTGAMRSASIVVLDGDDEGPRPSGGAVGFRQLTRNGAGEWAAAGAEGVEGRAAKGAGGAGGGGGGGGARVARGRGNIRAVGVEGVDDIDDNDNDDDDEVMIVESVSAADSDPSRPHKRTRVASRMAVAVGSSDGGVGSSVGGSSGGGGSSSVGGGGGGSSCDPIALDAMLAAGLQVRWGGMRARGMGWATGGVLRPPPIHQMWLRGCPALCVLCACGAATL